MVLHNTEKGISRDIYAIASYHPGLIHFGLVYYQHWISRCSGAACMTSPAYTRLHFNWSVWLNMFYKNINISFHLEEIWASPNLLISYTLCLLIKYHHFKHIQPFPIIVIMKHRNLKKKMFLYSVAIEDSNWRKAPIPYTYISLFVYVFTNVICVSMRRAWMS